MMEKKAWNDNAFYHEVCLLRRLAEFGYLDQEDLKEIAQIAAEDYGSSIVIDETFLCLKS